ncbi:MAG TPA: EF-P lysine aminoacylase EpmA [Gammaproteobacteria bacterium]|nr:EF-P lysine aminoacylase EpmA [Gammaproteobacteria bacterium]
MSYVATATHATLRTRAEILAAIRAFFATRGALEVETPALSSAGVTDPALESVVAEVRSLGRRQYLHTSPEFAMKRLLAAGSGDIYQICRVFRDDELGRWHQPEFTLLEWYRVGWDEMRLMTEVEALFGSVLAAAGHGAPLRSVRIRYGEAVAAALGVGADAPTPELAARLAAVGIDVPPGLGHDALLDLAMATVVPASFPADALTFLYDYPASQSALARLKPGHPPVAARFEVFGRGIELANGFHELCDATEQRRRFVADLAARRTANRPAPPIDEALLAALAAGLPDCAGVAVGLDRLIALATGHTDVASVVSFAHVRPEDGETTA